MLPGQAIPWCTGIVRGSLQTPDRRGSGTVRVWCSGGVLPRRWVVERSFGWVARFRRLARDYERLPETLKDLHFLAFAILMAHRFGRCMAFCL
jgi:transposase